jgi:hypothetical protein
MVKNLENLTNLKKSTGIHPKWLKMGVIWYDLATDSDYGYKGCGYYTFEIVDNKIFLKDYYFYKSEVPQSVKLVYGSCYQIYLVN